MPMAMNFLRNEKISLKKGSGRQDFICPSFRCLYLFVIQKRDCLFLIDRRLCRFWRTHKSLLKFAKQQKLAQA